MNLSFILLSFHMHEDKIWNDSLLFKLRSFVGRLHNIFCHIPELIFFFIILLILKKLTSFKS